MSIQTQQRLDKKNVYRHRIAEIVPKVIAEEVIFQEELDLEEAIEYATEVMSELPLPQFDAYTDIELKECVEGLLAHKLVFGMLSDLTPEEMKIFDEAVARR